MSQPAVATSVQEGWEMVRAFTEANNPAAVLALNAALQAAAAPGAASVSESLAPQLLQHCLTCSGVSPSALQFVCILNRNLCYRYIPEAFSRPLDGRPRGVGDLLLLYHAVLTSPSALPAAARAQLIGCEAVLLVLCTENIGDALRQLCEELRPTPTAEAVAYYSELLTCVADVLVDRRVALGPVRRAVQRTHLQRNLDVALHGPAGAEVLPAEVRALGRVVSFLFECVAGEPQEVAARLFELLPSSRQWHWALAHLGDPQADTAEMVVGTVCQVLQCLNRMDAPATALLQSCLPVALAHQLPLCSSLKIIISALEAATEDIVLHLGPDNALYGLFSSSAQYMLSILESPEATVEIRMCVYEGISVLTQVLRPTDIPPMDADDDPEDFEEFASVTRKENDDKRRALDQLHGFLTMCHTLLACHLGGLLAGKGAAEAMEELAAYALEKAKESEEDFQVAFDLYAVALFTCYERTCRLLGGAPAQVVEAGVLHRGGLVFFATSAPAALECLLASPPGLLLPQCALLPVLVERFVRTGASGSADAMWPVESAPSVVGGLLALLGAAVGQGAVGAARYVLEALLFQLRACGADHACIPACRAHLQGLGAALWALAVAHPGRAHLAEKWCLAEALCLLYEQRYVPACTAEVVQALRQHDARTQTEVLASQRLAEPGVLDYLLQLLGTVDDVPAVRRACERIARYAAAVCGAADGAGDWSHYVATLEKWNAANVRYGWICVMLTVALPPRLAGDATAQALLRYFAQEDALYASPEEVSILFGDAALHCILAGGNADLMTRVLQLIEWLLDAPHAFGTAKGVHRLLRMVRWAWGLLEHLTRAAPPPVFFPQLFHRALTRYAEYVVPLGSEGDDEDVGAAEEVARELAVLAGLLTAARCRQTAPPCSRGWRRQATGRSESES
ncbi:hypothetical protein STCU_08129 [Strigomonas culicis]|uniref:Uncharacterized protein n=1 Tax=Strigomonas culicis TaxID=28005 RepID=S9TWD1_9TRYP|nr:hypothetical protein STCU_08129 [Strigomonas culicis]|eukprot:EPY22787.1 hypothetical protein STCU_08129 [Strigomonas culicis]